MAKVRWTEQLRAGTLRRHTDASQWVDKWLDEQADRILEEHLRDQERVRRSWALKVIRAHRGGIVCLDRQRLDYPPENAWNRKRFRLKHWHQYACYLCGARESDRTRLHAHHIVHRSKSGTNADRNLVTLCYACHQQQHPDFPISVDGGEPRGVDPDETLPNDAEAATAGHSTLDDEFLPKSFEESAYSAVRPALVSALASHRQQGKNLRQLFAFLIDVFGSNVGRYALRFAAEENLKRGPL